MQTMHDLLQEAAQRKASDLHITVGLPPILRIDGRLIPLDKPVLSAGITEQYLAAVAGKAQQEAFQQAGETDFSYAIAGCSRFRVNAFRQRGTVAMVVRLIAEAVPNLNNLGFPESVRNLARKTKGLVLVTGPTGCGKSTTLAAMIDLINSERSCHILTLEDPIEYLHMHKQSIVNQREIHADTVSFASALRAALREDPDVILVGELRDAETIGTAITAAETGHLVLATLHTGDAAQTIDRIIDVFPPFQQQQIRLQLSLTLQGVIAQQLLPRSTGTGRVAALEILVATPAVRNLIREGKSHQILSVLQTGVKQGMQAMDMGLRDLYIRQEVTYEEAFERATDPAAFARLTGRI